MARAEYNNTAETGGDSLREDLNIYYDRADMVWIMLSTALVFLMIPGIAFLYSGMARRKSALSLIWVCLITTGLVSLQWFIIGYTLAFSHTSGPFIGNFANVGFRNVLARPSVVSREIPDILFAIYQCMFACVTVALVVGAVAERGRMLPCVIWIVVWSTVVYAPVAAWTFNPNGWTVKLGTLDFAGGTTVHTNAGFAALAYSFMLGKRRGHGTRELNYRPHSIAFVVLGTFLLWVGWFGFNGGSAYSMNLRVVISIVNSNMSAAVGGVFWCLLDYRIMRKWSAVGFCSGAIAGLVVITPASGFVPTWASIIFGVIGAVTCNYGTKIKYLLNIDDALDIFAVHGVGGIVGDLLTAVFSADYIAHLDGYTVIEGGWLNQHWIQIAYQAASGFAAASYSFVVTCLILYVINFIPGCKLRVSPQEEIFGIDDIEIGEFAYDYVKLTRDAINYETMNNMLQVL